MSVALQTLLNNAPRIEPGEVWLVGAGPGDPALLTLQAVALLAQAEAVVYDALLDPRVLDLTPPTAERIFAGKRGGKPSPAQADITDRLIGLARTGRRVVRLKGGDPFVFGRGGEEVFSLAAAGVPFHVAPGLTAGLAALTSAGVPATLRGVNQLIVLATGHPGPDQPEPNWAAIARLGQPIVLYMALGRLAAISAALLDGGLPPQTPAAAICSATTVRQAVLVSSLSALAAEVRDAGLDAPAIVLIGEIVAARETLAALVRREAAA